MQNLLEQLIAQFEESHAIGEDLYWDIEYWCAANIEPDVMNRLCIREYHDITPYFLKFFPQYYYFLEKLLFDIPSLDTKRYMNLINNDEINWGFGNHNMIATYYFQGLHDLIGRFSPDGPGNNMGGFSCLKYAAYAVYEMEAYLDFDDVSDFTKLWHLDSGVQSKYPRPPADSMYYDWRKFSTEPFYNVLSEFMKIMEEKLARPSESAD